MLSEFSAGMRNGTTHFQKVLALRTYGRLQEDTGREKPCLVVATKYKYKKFTGGGDIGIYLARRESLHCSLCLKIVYSCLFLLFLFFIYFYVNVDILNNMLVIKVTLRSNTI